MSVLTLAPSHTPVLSAIVVLRATMLSAVMPGYIAKMVLQGLAVR